MDFSMNIIVLFRALIWWWVMLVGRRRVVTTDGRPKTAQRH
jgi:hypothetical protein